jgi:hypothetical protein
MRARLDRTPVTARFEFGPAGLSLASPIGCAGASFTCLGSVTSATFWPEPMVLPQVSEIRLRSLGGTEMLQVLPGQMVAAPYLRHPDDRPEPALGYREGAQGGCLSLSGRAGLPADTSNTGRDAGHLHDVRRVVAIGVTRAGRDQARPPSREQVNQPMSPGGLGVSQVAWRLSSHVGGDVAVDPPLGDRVPGRSRSSVLRLRSANA